ncbi:RNA-binding motif, single-stranded-interacting protein 3-like [Hyaena hyaena]|nr:RNA-binding motif, single-stranded-interacting protein 3-like [Hyaena hyaena]
MEERENPASVQTGRWSDIPEGGSSRFSGPEACSRSTVREQEGHMNLDSQTQWNRYQYPGWLLPPHCLTQWYLPLLLTAETHRANDSSDKTNYWPSPLDKEEKQGQGCVEKTVTFSFNSFEPAAKLNYVIGVRLVYFQPLGLGFPTVTIHQRFLEDFSGYHKALLAGAELISLPCPSPDVGYGFVDFDSPAAAQKAVASLKANGVQAQMAKQQEQDPTNLYISNLPISMDEQELENMLKPFGHVISTRILRDANGVSRGVGFARMESTEKCEVVIQHFNGKYLKTPPGIPAPSEPLLCKFADGGQKKRQNQSKYTQNGRPWPREGEAGMALTYDPTAAIQNGFYSSPYSIATNRMIPQTSLTPFIAASPVSTYQVQSTSWMPHPPYVMQPTGAVITPTMDHPMSMQPANMMGPLTQQMNHLSLGTTGTIQSQDRIMILHQLLCQYMTAAAPMQGTYIPQYTPVPPTAVSIEGVVADTSPQTVAPSSQDTSGQQQQIAVDTSNEHAPAYSYQQSKP